MAFDGPFSYRLMKNGPSVCMRVQACACVWVSTGECVLSVRGAAEGGNVERRDTVLNVTPLGDEGLERVLTMFKDGSVFALHTLLHTAIMLVPKSHP